MTKIIPHEANTVFYSPFYRMLNDFFADDRQIGSDTFNIDVRSCEESYIVEAELPGVKKEDVKLDFDNDCLSISVERKDESETKEGNYIHRERKFSAMKRSIRLQNVSREGINAKMEEGMLIVEVPKLKREQMKTAIEIS